jgi:hypothetical protein
VSVEQGIEQACLVWRENDADQLRLCPRVCALGLKLRSTLAIYSLAHGGCSSGNLIAGIKAGALAARPIALAVRRVALPSGDRIPFGPGA